MAVSSYIRRPRNDETGVIGVYLKKCEFRISIDLEESIYEEECVQSSIVVFRPRLGFDCSICRR
ncbi:MAG: hypothetical protein PHF75_06470, partial [Gallionella sp.]|nr:hypothetical protein [Gallionella sp.]